MVCSSERVRDRVCRRERAQLDRAERCRTATRTATMTAEGSLGLNHLGV